VSVPISEVSQVELARLARSQVDFVLHLDE